MSPTLLRRLVGSDRFIGANNALAKMLNDRLARRALDMSERSRHRSTLVLAPHPDDETLGCGATIWHKRRAGTAVTVVVATDGRLSHRSAQIGPDELASQREAESRRACAALGVEPDAVRFLRHPEGSLTGRRALLQAELEGLLEELSPQEVLLPAGIDRLEDHRILNEVGRRALRSLAARSAAGATAIEAFEYPVWLWDPRAWMDREAGALRRGAQLIRRPVHALRRLEPAVVRIADALPAKERALAEYRSQMTRLTGEEDWAVMDPRFLRLFLGDHELFFTLDIGAPLPVGAGVGVGAGR